MSPAAALLTRVRAAGAELVVHGDGLRWRAPEPLPTELLVALKVHKSELLAYLRESAGLAVYRRRIEEARSWDDLYAVLADAEVAYSANELTGDEVEDLVLHHTCATRPRDRGAPLDRVMDLMDLYAKPPSHPKRTTRGRRSDDF